MDLRFTKGEVKPKLIFFKKNWNSSDKKIWIHHNYPPQSTASRRREKNLLIISDGHLLWHDSLLKYICSDTSGCILLTPRDTSEFHSSWISGFQLEQTHFWMGPKLRQFPLCSGSGPKIPCEVSILNQLNSFTWGRKNVAETVREPACLGKYSFKKCIPFVLITL